MRLKFRPGYFLFYGLLLLLSSCASLGKISIQVSVPPTHILSKDIQSVVMMNRSMTSEFSNLDQDSLENLLVRKKLVMDELLLDSLAADSTLKVAGNVMYESGRFDVVIPVQRNLTNINSTYSKKIQPLSLSQVKQICNEFKTDALLSMESFGEKVSTSYQAGYDRMTDLGVSKTYTIFVQIAFQSTWKLYQPGEKLKTASFEVKDTIFWEKTAGTLQETYEQLPTIKNAMIAGAIENGKSIAGYFSPGWRSQIRYYFITHNKSADLAINHVNNNNWNEAGNVWLKYADSSSSGLRSQIEFNLALVSEMNGELTEAIKWVKKSLQSKYSKVAEEYLKTLQINQLDSITSPN